MKLLLNPKKRKEKKEYCEPMKLGTTSKVCISLITPRTRTFEIMSSSRTYSKIGLTKPNLVHKLFKKGHGIPIDQLNQK